MNSKNNKIQIIPFEEKYDAVFKQLNLEWLMGYELFEDADLEYLDKPQQAIIEKGGRILMATMDGVVVGTCAIIREGASIAELAKLAVSPDTQGKGIGRMLAEESIRSAQNMGFNKLILVSNKKLLVAIQLYESLGFMHAPIPENTLYKTADVYMEKNIPR